MTPTRSLDAALALREALRRSNLALRDVDEQLDQDPERLITRADLYDLVGDLGPDLDFAAADAEAAIDRGGAAAHIVAAVDDMQAARTLVVNLEDLADGQLVIAASVLRFAIRRAVACSDRAWAGWVKQPRPARGSRATPTYSTDTGGAS